ncbi:MAG TPA: 23S rRNA (guanosine(2251)-2'-O)-methyltransferase RlmB [Gammaproteobacteria bacterium]|nr:23S rRNA (guanosine(2251)-2'-O)-methyltransferase RlmB [Gammaproteobacteria bacterium]
MGRGNRIFGVHAVNALLEQHPDSARHLYLQDEHRGQRLAALAQRARDHGIPVSRHARRELDDLSGGGRHQGVVLDVAGSPELGEQDLDDLLDAVDHAPLLLVLDGVQDPHNLGACLRTAAGAGADAVIIPRDRAAPLSAAARKVAAGAAERLPLVRVPNLARVLRKLRRRGVWLVGAEAGAGRSLFRVELDGSVALVLGAEGRGLRRLTRESCDYLVRIPLAGGVESLNVSVAAGICLYEAVRQRGG